MTAPQDPFASPGGTPPAAAPPPSPESVQAASPYAAPYGGTPGYGSPETQVGYSPSGQPLSSKGRRFGGMWLSLLLMIVTLGIGYLVWAFIAYGKSTTPAKQVLKMTVVDAKTGAPLDYGRMALRQIVYGVAVMSVVPFLSLVDAGFILFGGDKNQRLVDKMASSLVVDGRPPAA